MGFFTRKRDNKSAATDKLGGRLEDQTGNQPADQPTKPIDYRWIDTDEQIAVKFWLPDQLQKLIDELAAAQDESASSLIRRTLFMYLYGRYAYFTVKTARSKPSEQSIIRIYGDEDCLMQPVIPQPAQERGPRGGRIPEMGKNDNSFKLWLPKRMRDDLQALADASKVTLSLHIREVLATDLMGRVYIPDRESMIRGTEKS